MVGSDQERYTHQEQIQSNPIQSNQTTTTIQFNSIVILYSDRMMNKKEEEWFIDKTTRTTRRRRNQQRTRELGVIDMNHIGPFTNSSSSWLILSIKKEEKSKGDLKIDSHTCMIDWFNGKNNDSLEHDQYPKDHD